MKFLNYSFLLFFAGTLSASVPSPQDVEGAVKEFDTEFRNKLKNNPFVNFNAETKKFRSSLVEKYLPLWELDIYSSAPVTQTIYNVEVPIFKSQVPGLVEQYKTSQKIGNIPDYSNLVIIYERKLDHDAIQDLKSEQEVKDYVVSKKVKKIVDSQIAKPSKDGIDILVRQILQDLGLLKNDSVLVQMQLENFLNQKFGIFRQ